MLDKWETLTLINTHRFDHGMCLIYMSTEGGVRHEWLGTEHACI